MISGRTLQRVLGYLSFYVLPLVLVGLSYGNGFDEHFFKELGEPALNLLLFILFLPPFSQITNWTFLRILMGWRREFGVAAFWFFLFHGAGMIYSENLTDINTFLDPNGYLFWGGIAGIGMLILGLTSNDLSVKLLKRNWKRLQLIAIPTLFFAHAHVSIIEYRSLVPTLILVLVYVALRIFGAYCVRRRVLAKRMNPS